MGFLWDKNCNRGLPLVLYGSLMLPKDTLKNNRNKYLRDVSGAWIQKVLFDINPDKEVVTEAFCRIDGVVDIPVEVVRI